MLYEKWATLVAEVEYVQKTGNNQHHRYTYVKEEDLLDAIRPIMSRLGLVFYPVKAEVIPVRGENESVGTGTLLTVRYTYRLVDADTGEHADMQIIAQGSDSQDKGAYKAATGARKYALRQLLLAATGDDPEEDDDSDGKGVVNTNAIPVIRKLKDVGFFTSVRVESDLNYDRLTEFTGIELKKFPNTAKGTEALKKVWAFAVDFGRGGDPDDAKITDLGISVRELVGKKTASA